MAGRRLDADERALWSRVTASVRPIANASRPRPPVAASTAPARAANPSPASGAAPHSPAGRARVVATVFVPPPAVGETLDGGWDRRLRRGAAAPDITVDLHGHTLASAHAELDRRLQGAIASGARLMLLITGKPRPRAQDAASGVRRGAIRASVGDWLAASRHAGSIAAVRQAHPRHGGSGALYVILRRTKSRGRQD